MTRGPLQCILVHLLWLWLPFAAGAQSVQENDLKAAFIYNFILFTEWPQASESAAISLCVNGASALRPALSSLQDKAVKGRRIQVTSFDTLDPALRHCGVLFIDSLDRRHWPGLKKGLASLPVLTISDEADMLRSERTMISLSQREHKLVFDIDLAAVRQGGLTISSKLLRLARSAQ